MTPQPLTPAQQSLVESAIPLAFHIGNSMRRRNARYRWLDPDAYYSAVTMALVEAVQKHDPARGALGTYLQLRLRWRLNEELRELGVARLPHRFTQNWSDQDEETKRLATNALRRCPVGQWHQDRRQASPTDTPALRWLDVETGLLKHLGPRERSLVALYFRDGLNLPEIARRWDLTHQRVQMLLARALERLRKEFRTAS